MLFTELLLCSFNNSKRKGSKVVSSFTVASLPFEEAERDLAFAV
jgi:hypothetical protein